MAPARFFLGRQPILDRHGDIHGYELLFRSSGLNAAHIEDGRHATVQVITQAYHEFGMDAVLGDALGFVNLDTELGACEAVDALPAERVVLEILETTEFSAEAVASLRALHEKGYRLALDDITVLQPAHREILPYVSYVKVDLRDMTDEALRGLVGQLKTLGITLLAEKVETHRQHELCMELGFDYFQGYFFAHPEVLTGNGGDPARQQMMRVLQLIQSDADQARIEAVFKGDPKLTYNLLRLVNSVSMGLNTRIMSVSHAITLLGRRQLLRWLSLLLFAQKGGGSFPNPLAIMAAFRGRFMERLALAAGQDELLAEAAFMTGMMSLLVAVLEMPMSRIVSELNLADPVRGALLEHAGVLGDLLRITECVEACDAGALGDLLKRLDISLDQAMTTGIAAMAWANAIGKEA